MLCLNISDIAIITIKHVDYCCIIHYISKFEAIHLLKNSVLDHCGYIWNACQKSILKILKKVETGNIFIYKKSYKDLVFYVTRYHPDKSITMLNQYYDELIAKTE